jgi:5-bromo-4-chloroindolyl phosphate hydrolysis protein
MLDSTVIWLILQYQKLSKARKGMWEVKRTVNDNATAASLQQINVIKFNVTSCKRRDNTSEQTLQI